MRKTDVIDPASQPSVKDWFSIFGLTIVLVAGLVGLGLGRQSAQAASACSSSSAGTYVTSVTLAKSGNYTVWAHMKTPSSSADLLLLGINGTCYPIGDSGSIPANAWTWVDYFRNSSSIVQRSFVQGTQNVTIIGASPNVKVDKIEFLSDGCTPTGDGSNCASSSQASGGTSATGSAAIAISTAPNNSGDISIFGDGGTITPANTGIPTEISAPFVTIQPDTYSSTNDPIEEVDYSLSGKWLATVTSDPFSYRLNVRHLLNGTYTLSTKITYKSGKATTTSQKLIIKNPASPTQFILAAEHYIVYEVAAVIILIAGFLLFRRWRSSRR